MPLNETLTRALIAFGIILGGFSLYLTYNWILKNRASNLLADLGPVRPGAFLLVYFTTPTCVPCKTVQRPAIQKLSDMLGSTLQVLEIDASQQPDLASRWGVLSVPTTFLFDPRGQVRHVNHGVTRAEQLLLQIHEG
jgi:thiol-disulfide isomerase/thioredoxin